MSRHKIKIERSSWRLGKGSNLSKKDKICRKIIEYGILGLLIFSPLPAGSVNEWSILMIQLTVLVMLVAYYLLKKKPRQHDQLDHSMSWPKYFFFVFFLLLLIQVIPLPKFIIGIISPDTFSFKNTFSFDFQSMKFLSLSIIPAHTLREGLELISYFLLGFLIVKTVTKRDQIKKIFYVLIAVGIFEAIYGLFELYNNNPRILFYKKVY